MAEIAGLKLIVPSSVAGSGVSVSASGKVTFTAATTININGVFSSTYDNYLMVARFTMGTSDFGRIRYRASGTDASASNYTTQHMNVNGSSVTGGRATESSFVFNYLSSGGPNGSHVYLYGPALAQPTAGRAVNVDGDSAARIYENANTHSLSTAYDGLTVYTSTYGMTGSLTIYGLSQ